MAVQPMRAERAGVDDAANGAGLHKFVGARGCLDLEALREIDGPYAPCFCLHSLDGFKLLEASHPRLVDHEVLAGPHGLDGQIRALAGYGGAGDEVDGRVLDELATVGHAGDVGEALDEPLQRHHVMTGPEADALGAD